MHAKRLIGFISIIGTLCLFALGPGPAPVLAQTGEPQIMLPETEHNFGTVGQGEKLKHTFIIKNVGDAPLKLIKAKGS